MLEQSINLDIICETCQNNEYMEHDSGFYVCITCGTMSNVRHGLQVDFGDLNMKGKYRRKNFDEDDEYEHVNDNQDYTTTMTTCNDSFSNENSNGNLLTKKTLNEILYEHQEIFVKLFKSIYYFKFLHSSNKNLLNHNSILNVIENFKNEKNLLESFISAKTHWINFIENEYISQTKLKKPTYRNTKVRSRRNTDDEGIYSKSGRKSSKIPVRDELKIRGLKYKNITNLSDYKISSIQNKEKLRKFVEEYDEVMKHLNEMKEVLEENLNINFNDGIRMKELLLIAKYLGIVIEKNSLYEEVIHQFFICRELNYTTLYSEKNYDENKSNLNGNYYLYLFNKIFNDERRNNYILIRDLISLFRNFEFNNLIEKNEIKFMKYTCKEKLFKLFEEKKISILKLENILKKICEDILKFPNFFTKFCLNLYINYHKVFEKSINHTYNCENFAIGLIIFSMKLFYGMNDLPYLINIEKNSKRFNISELILNKFHEIKNNDKLYSFYKQMPSLLDIIQLLVNLIKLDNNNKIIWESQDFKNYLTKNYKDKYVKYNNEILYKVELNNYSSSKNIIELQKRYQEEDICNSIPDNDIMIDVKFSDKFKQKLKQENKRNDMRSFLVEELEFYKNLDINKKSIQISLPCDNYLRYKKQALKFNGVSLPETELFIYYLFSIYFNVPYKVMKKVSKLIELAVEKVKK